MIIKVLNSLSFQIPQAVRLPPLPLFLSCAVNHVQGWSCIKNSPSRMDADRGTTRVLQVCSGASFPQTYLTHSLAQVCRAYPSAGSSPAPSATMKQSTNCHGCKHLYCQVQPYAWCFFLRSFVEPGAKHQQPCRYKQNSSSFSR